jgi:methionyl-tRNA synthetase
MNKLSFSKALEVIWDLLSHVNKYITDSAPWKMIDDESQRTNLATILLTSTEIIRIVTVLLSPVLPVSCSNVWNQLGIQEKLDQQRIDELEWGNVVGGCTLGKIEPVFPRLDKKSIIKKLVGPIGVNDGKKEITFAEKVQMPKDAPPATESNSSDVPRIKIDDFMKIDLRVGQVISAEKVKGTDRLLKLLVDLGTENRQIIAGIAQSYKEDELIGKKIVVVFNLQPRKMRGLDSNGMLLAASVGENEGPVLATFLEEVPNGARLK